MGCGSYNGKVRALQTLPPKTVLNMNTHCVCARRYLHDSDIASPGKTILELGAGCGMPGLVAALSGASVVGLFCSSTSEMKGQ